MAILAAILGLLKPLFDIISGVAGKLKRKAIEVAYQKADKAEKGQAEAEHEAAKLRREKAYEDELDKPDDEFWRGGSDY